MNGYIAILSVRYGRKNPHTERRDIRFTAEKYLTDVERALDEKTAALLESCPRGTKVTIDRILTIDETLVTFGFKKTKS